MSENFISNYRVCTTELLIKYTKIYMHLPLLLLEPVKSLLFGVLVTCNRPMATRQQCVEAFSSVTTPSGPACTPPAPLSPRPTPGTHGGTKSPTA